MAPLRPQRALRLATAVALAGLSLAGCGESDGSREAGATVTTRSTPAVPTALDQALWPDPADARRATSPRDVARSFVADFVGVENPAIGEFQEGEPRAGEVPVLRRGEDGRATDRVIATVVVRRLDGERWFVTAALSEEIELRTPEVLRAIASPVTIAGTAVGHEGNVILRVHAAFERAPLARTTVIAGATRKQPFSAQVAFEPHAADAADAGVVVARAGQPLPGADAFVAVPVRFADGS